MKKDKNYQKLLNKMLTIENAGEILYKALIRKTKDNNLRLIYERLALNERETARYIAKEILTTDNNLRKSISGLMLNLTKLICAILRGRQLAWVLKIALKRRAYSRWHNRYKDSNQDFWRSLLSHENLQHELLKPFWSN